MECHQFRTRVLWDIWASLAVECSAEQICCVQDLLATGSPTLVFVATRHRVEYLQIVLEQVSSPCFASTRCTSHMQNYAASISASSMHDDCHCFAPPQCNIRNFSTYL